MSLRFIIKRRQLSECMDRDDLYTIDADVPELERALRSGGYGPGGCDSHTLLGVEILPEPVAQDKLATLERFWRAYEYSTIPGQSVVELTKANDEFLSAQQAVRAAMGYETQNRDARNGGPQ